MLYLKILFLLGLVNLAPPLMTYFLEDRWNTPLDRGMTLGDGNPLFGPHKTIRGILSAVAAGTLAAFLLGLSPWIGFWTGVLAMAGDLISSFIKRRFTLKSGFDVPGLDQGFEGIFPLVYLHHRLEFSFLETFALFALFSIMAYAGSMGYKRLLLTPPDGYPRPLKPRTRFREITSCNLRSPFLRRFFNFEDAVYYHFIIKSFFKLTGLYDRGVLNALNFRINRFTIETNDLPPSFDGFTILFLSDLHLDGLPGLFERLQTLLPTLPADCCILGGDYRMSTHGTCTEANYRLQNLLSSVTCPEGTFAVLGNHDCLEMLEVFEQNQATVLLNDSRAITRNGETIWIVGVDDPHYYRCHDLDMAFSGVPEKAFSLFVAHSPKLYREAGAKGASVYLAGHTHAGQIQIPPLGPVFTHCPAPRKYCLGRWEYGGTQGFTTSGVGVSGVPVRYNCFGEVALITLSRTLSDEPAGSGPEQTTGVE